MKNAMITKQESTATYVAKVYGWMFIGLLVTMFTALGIANDTSFINYITSSKWALIALLVVQLGLVSLLVMCIDRMSVMLASLTFFIYAILNGVLFSVILASFSANVLLSTLGSVSAIFAIMGLFGYYTKKDLTSFGNLMLMGLLGVFVASLINLFLGSELLYWIISYVGIAVFVGLIAYDTQKIKEYAIIEDKEAKSKASIVGALSLYLDFINLFLMMLRVVGGRN